MRGTDTALGEKKRTGEIQGPKKMSGLLGKANDPIWISEVFSAKEGSHTTNRPPSTAPMWRPNPPITTPTSSESERPRPNGSGVRQLPMMPSSSPATPAQTAGSAKASDLSYASV